MRIYFNSMARPKRVARTMQDIFPLEKLSQCQAWTAKIYGYRDWHELEQTTRTGDHEPSPDDEDLGEEENFTRGTKLAHVVTKVLGIELLDNFFVAPRLNLTSRKPVAPARRAAKIPKGTNPFYTLIQTDMIDCGDRDVNATASDEYFAYAVVPPDYGKESDYRAKLIKMLKLKAEPYPGYAEDCEAILMQPYPQETQFFWAQDELNNTIWLSQILHDRLYVFGEDDQPVGFLDLSLTIEAGSDRDDSNSLEMRINEAWIVEEEQQWLLSSMASEYFSGTVTKLLLAWRRAEQLPLDLKIISDSEHLLARHFLEIVVDQAANVLSIDREDITVYSDPPRSPIMQLA